MAAPKTVLTYPLNGATKDFTIPFEYLARKFVVVTLIGKIRQTLILNSDYRFTNRTTVTTTKAWGPADAFSSVEIRRVTSATDRLVDFADGSILRAYDLNTAQVQSLHIAEEARDLTADTIGVNNDGDLDARGRRIVNVADAVLDGDAVTLRQEKAWGAGALNQANRSEVMANESARHATNSSNSSVRSEQMANESNRHATRSEAAAGQSSASQVAAKDSQDIAVANANLSKAYATMPEDQLVQPGLYSSFHYSRKSADSAAQAYQDANRSTQQADRSKTEADRAKFEADKLGNANSLMEVIEVSGIAQGGTRYKPDLSLVMQGAGDLYKSTSAGLQKYFNQADFDPAKKKDVDAGMTGSMNMMFWHGDSNLGTSAGAYSGALELREKNLVSTANQGDQAMGPSIAFHYSGYAVKQLFMDSGGVLRWGNQYVGGQPHIQLTDTNGRINLDDGSSYVDFNGNVKSRLYEDGTLYDELLKHRAMRDQIRSEKHYPLWSGSFGTGQSITLNSPASGYEYFFFDNTDGIYNSGIFLPGISMGKRFYLQCAGGGWYTLRWNDANYTSLTMVDAGGSAKVITSIYGVAHKGASLGR